MCIFVSVWVPMQGLEVQVGRLLGPPHLPSPCQPGSLPELRAHGLARPAPTKLQGSAYPELQTHVKTLCFSQRLETQTPGSRLPWQALSLPGYPRPQPLDSRLCSTKKRKYFSAYSIATAPMQQQVISVRSLENLPYSFPCSCDTANPHPNQYHPLGVQTKPLN